MNVNDVKCPKCGGEINSCWFYCLLGKNKAIFICACWSGDLDKDNEDTHYFRLIVDLEETVYLKHEGAPEK